MTWEERAEGWKDKYKKSQGRCADLREELKEFQEFIEWGELEQTWAEFQEEKKK